MQIYGGDLLEIYIFFLNLRTVYALMLAKV